MPSPNGKRFKLAEMRQQASEALGMDPGAELELDNGDVITVPHPMWVSEETQERIEKAQGTIESAKAVLGDDHERLLAGGGRSADVMLLWRLLAEDLADPKSRR